MDNAIKTLLGAEILSKKKLTGGVSFNTWLLCLNNNQKVIFRAGEDNQSGKRWINITETFLREEYFYQSVNTQVGSLFPTVLAIDGSCRLYHTPFQIYTFLEGQPLDRVLPTLSASQVANVEHRSGQVLAGIHRCQIPPSHPFLLQRGQWMPFFLTRLSERLYALADCSHLPKTEIEQILSHLATQQPKGECRAFLHMDFRPCNCIYQNGALRWIDAENCEWGDPLFELARMDVNGLLTPAFLAGYTDVWGGTPDFSTLLYIGYKLEALAFLAWLYQCEVTDDPATTHMFVSAFTQTKQDFFTAIQAKTGGK